jgi:hypothetical protein
MKRVVQALIVVFFIVCSAGGLAADKLSEFNNCVAQCNQVHGSCVSYCNGDAECLNRCATARGECVSGCNSAMW